MPKTSSICSAVSIKLRLVTDRQNTGPLLVPALAQRRAGKNRKKRAVWFTDLRQRRRCGGVGRRPRRRTSIGRAARRRRRASRPATSSRCALSTTPTRRDTCTPSSRSTSPTAPNTHTPPCTHTSTHRAVRFL